MLSLGQRGFHTSEQKFPAQTLLDPTWHLPAADLGQVLLRGLKKGKRSGLRFAFLKGCWPIPLLKLQLQLLYTELNPPPVRAQQTQPEPEAELSAG